MRHLRFGPAAPALCLFCSLEIGSGITRDFRPRGVMLGHHGEQSGLPPPRSRRSRDANEVGPVSSSFYTSRNGPQLWYSPNFPLQPQTKVGRARLLAISNRPPRPPDRLRRPDDRRSGAHFTPTFGSNSKETPSLLAVVSDPASPKICQPCSPQSVNRGGAYFREMHVPAPKASRELFRLFLLYNKRPVCWVWPSELISQMSNPPKCT
jgi:hypothetical protein